jgi:hypothetical protein
MLILSVGAASILALFAAAAATHRRSVDRTRAALVAERVLGELKALYTPGKEPGDVMADLQKRLPETIGDYRYEAVVFHPEGDEWAESELFARVLVKWRESGSDRAEAFHSILLPRYRLGELPDEEDDRGRKRK